MATLLNEDLVRAALGTVMDPDLPHDIVTLGLLRDIEIEGDHVWVHVVPTSAHCPFAGELKQRIADAITPLPGVRTVEVEWGESDR